MYGRHISLESFEISTEELPESDPQPQKDPVFIEVCNGVEKPTFAKLTRQMP